MLFNSLDFAVFLPLVFFLYWFVFQNNLKTQNIFLLLASYFFYSFWNWKFMLLILFSTSVNYIFGHLVGKNSSKKKTYLIIGILLNLSLLGFFKYYNFFIENFVSVFRLFGSELHITPLKIILPIGISFYTFQGISYL